MTVTIQKTTKSKSKKPKKWSKTKLATINEFLQLSDEELREKLPDKTDDDKEKRVIAEEAREARLILIQRYLSRGITKGEIAKQLGLSVSMVYYLIKQLQEKVVNDLNKMKWPVYIAETIAFYDEIRQNAMLVASTSKATNSAAKMGCFRTAMRAEEEKQRFLALCGIFKSETAIALAQRTMLPGHDDTDQMKHEDAVVAEFTNDLASLLMNADMVDGEFTEVEEEMGEIEIIQGDAGG